MGITIVPVDTARARGDFLRVPWLVYRGNRCWVPPLISEMRRIIDARRNGYLRKGPFRLFVAYRGGRPVGRIMAGADEVTNGLKGKKEGWFSLFETVDDYEAARALLDAAGSYLAALGFDRMRGPVSPTGGDDFRGLLIDAFTSPPVLMDSYNPPYYREFLERYGLAKHEDLYAYYFYRRPPKNPHAVEYAQSRYGFTLHPLDLRRLERDIRDIKTVLDRAMPADWGDMVPPTLDEVREMAMSLKAFADPDLVIIARAGTEPVGFNVTLPDLNQVLIHLRGRLWPLGWLKFLYWRRRIDALRFFVLFVVPEWRKRGVSAAIFHRTFEEARRKGITWGEGSSIGETNLPMRRDVERAGGQHYKTYRIYAGDLTRA
ncbi:MAG: N-acetyltransferase [Patescibacteria group bacterium]